MVSDRNPSQIVRRRKGAKGNRSEHSWSNNSRLRQEAKEILKTDVDLLELEQDPDKC